MAKSKAAAICVLGVLATGLLACGDDDSDAGGGAGGGGNSYASISENLSKPSGSLAASNAVGVAEAYERIASSENEKRQKQVGAQTISCPAGGSQKINTADVTSTSVRAEVTFNNCCQQSGCCLNGDGDWYYATQAGGEYPYCGRYDLTSTCSGTAQKLDFVGCIIQTRGWVYLVQLDGKSYAVSGSYGNGNGTLVIKDASSTWTCVYQNDRGSCTGGATAISF